MQRCVFQTHEAEPATAFRAELFCGAHISWGDFPSESSEQQVSLVASSSASESDVMLASLPKTDFSCVESVSLCVVCVCGNGFPTHHIIELYDTSAIHQSIASLSISHTPTRRVKFL